MNKHTEHAERTPRIDELRSESPAERSFDAPETALPSGTATLLAIDTALGTGVAISAGGSIFEAVSDDPMRHAEAIGELIATVLASSGVKAHEVEGVVFGVGPGPFTGLRVGLAAADAFALGGNIPRYPLHSHEAVALAAFEVSEWRGDTVRVVQDARRRELFVTDYTRPDADGLPVRMNGPRIEPRATYSSVEDEIWPERIPPGRLIQLACRRLAVGAPHEAPQALYLRQPDVKLPQQPKRALS